jgi:RHS repeat-associated protein
LQGGALRNTVITRSCPTCTTATSTMTYDANGNLATRIDYLGNRTNSTYDLTRNLETQRTEGLTAGGASTTATRTTSTQWHALYRFPVGVAEPLRLTTYTYDTAGNRLTKTIQATTDSNGSLGFAATQQGTPRTWTYTYTSFGRVHTIDGPRTDVSDVTTYAYFSDSDSCVGCRGQVQTVSNALNQITTYDNYDHDGRVTQLTDPNGVVSTLTYTARGWLNTRTVNAGQASAETTTYFYDGLGQLLQVLLPDSTYISYTYDNAHRLVDMNDSLGNVIEYTLDTMGNRIAESRFDPQDVLTQKRSMVYDQLNRLQQQLGGTHPTTDITVYGYDNNGNRLSTQDALFNVTGQQYDARNRLTQVTDAAIGVTGYGYDQLDQLIRVTDPRGLITQYSYDGLGNLNQLTSPDTGVTQYSYDSAGNLLTRTDALTQDTGYSYDALNRMATQAVTNGPSYAYSYDQGTFGVGRLSEISEWSAGGTLYTYDAFGRVATKSQTLHERTLTVGYGYAAGGKLNRITYPSGRVLTYGFDGAGRINSVTLDSTVLLNQVTWQPFGAPTGWTWGNGASHQRSYDLDGRITMLVLPALPDEQQSFGYDNLYRLTSATAVVSNLTLGYGYDATGNRTQETKNAATNQYSTAGNSNRLTGITGNDPRQFAFNANGSIITDTGSTFIFDGRERLIATGTTSYYVNALGQRIEKAGPGADTGSGVRQFVYDEAGHLLGEYDAATGAPIAEHFFLGDWPVGVLANSALYYVHPDHLGTPRVVTQATDNAVVWRWESSQPFGGDLANQNPSGLGTFSYNLRFPGQYFDNETGKHYNYYRDYDSTIGRYSESDPVGLRGGINTFAYANGDPLRYVDRDGLKCTCESYRSILQFSPFTVRSVFFCTGTDDKCARKKCTYSIGCTSTGLGYPYVTEGADDDDYCAIAQSKNLSPTTNQCTILYKLCNS